MHPGDLDAPFARTNSSRLGTHVSPYDRLRVITTQGHTVDGAPPTFNSSFKPRDLLATTHNLRHFLVTYERMQAEPVDTAIKVCGGCGGTSHMRAS